MNDDKRQEESSRAEQLSEHYERQARRYDGRLNEGEARQ